MQLDEKKDDKTRNNLKFNESMAEAKKAFVKWGKMCLLCHRQDFHFFELQ